MTRLEEYYNKFNEEKRLLRRHGQVEFMTTMKYIHKYLEPIYETHAGWCIDITQIKEYDKLPENAKKYLSRLEELLECPISIVSVGPDREQTIFKNTVE